MSFKKKNLNELWAMYTELTKPRDNYSQSKSSSRQSQVYTNYNYPPPPLPHEAGYQQKLEEYENRNCDSLTGTRRSFILENESIEDQQLSQQMHLHSYLNQSLEFLHQQQELERSTEDQQFSDPSGNNRGRQWQPTTLQHTHNGKQCAYAGCEFLQTPVPYDEFIQREQIQQAPERPPKRPGLGQEGSQPVHRVHVHEADLTVVRTSDIPVFNVYQARHDQELSKSQELLQTSREYEIGSQIDIRPRDQPDSSSSSSGSPSSGSTSENEMSIPSSQEEAQADRSQTSIYVSKEQIHKLKQKVKDQIKAQNSCGAGTVNFESTEGSESFQTRHSSSFSSHKTGSPPFVNARGDFEYNKYPAKPRRHSSSTKSSSDTARVASIIEVEEGDESKSKARPKPKETFIIHELIKEMPRAQDKPEPKHDEEGYASKVQELINAPPTDTSILTQSHPQQNSVNSYKITEEYSEVTVTTIKETQEVPVPDQEEHQQTYFPPPPLSTSQPAAYSPAPLSSPSSQQYLGIPFPMTGGTSDAPDNPEKDGESVQGSIDYQEVLIQSKPLVSETKAPVSRKGSATTTSTESWRNQPNCRVKCCSLFVFLLGCFIGVGFLAGGIIIFQECDDGNMLPFFLICKLKTFW